MATKIKFFDSGGNVLIEQYITRLPLKEQKVIEKSIEMFSDSEPCIIHKTCAIKKIYIEIDDYINSLLEDGIRECLWKDIPENIEAVLNINKFPYKIIIE
jgi:hypothetical protein